MKNGGVKSEPKSEKPKIHPKGQTANPKEKRYGQFVPITDKTLNEPESEQQLTHYYKIIFTLQSGVQIEILSTTAYNEDEMVDKEGGIAYYKIKGFAKTPLLVEKSIEIPCPKVAAIEVIKDPCIAQLIPWPKDKEFNDIPVVGGTNEPCPALVLSQIDGANQHDGIDGQPINLSPSLRCKDGFGPLVLSEIDGAGQDKTKGIRIGHPQVGPIEN